MGGKYLSDADWGAHAESLMACIPTSLEEGHKQSLKARVKYGNEFSLRKRIQGLVAGMSIDTATACPSTEIAFLAKSSTQETTSRTLIRL